MSWSKQITIWCDCVNCADHRACHEYVQIDTGSIKKAREDAKQSLWQVGMPDYCPVCKKYYD